MCSWRPCYLTLAASDRPLLEFQILAAGCLHGVLTARRLQTHTATSAESGGLGINIWQQSTASMQSEVKGYNVLDALTCNTRSDLIRVLFLPCGNLLLQPLRNFGLHKQPCIVKVLDDKLILGRLCVVEAQNELLGRHVAACRGAPHFRVFCMSCREPATGGCRHLPLQQ